MISPEQKQKAIKLYRNKSLTLREVANLCDITPQHLLKLVRDAEKRGELVKHRNPEIQERDRSPKFTDAELEQIAVDYYENGLCKRELIEKWGIHPMQLQRVRNMFGDKYSKKTERKPVQQFDKYGNFIAEFPNGHQASLETGANYTSLNLCCNGKLKSAGGFVWKFKEENNV